jgi:hypothetical protein
MYREHHNRPKEAIPTRMQPARKKILLTKDIPSHLLEVKRIKTNKMSAIILDM